MLVIMKAGPELRSDAVPNLAWTCFSRFSDAYNENAGLSDSYLSPPDEDTAAEELEFHDGLTDPDYIKTLAAGWNGVIERDFDACLRQLYASAPTEDGRTRWLKAKITSIYALKKAAIALDGCVHDYADYALMVDSHGTLTSLFQDSELADLIAGPEDYVSFEVYPK